ncbi:MAG: hypothetical protein LBT09_05365 [Planctomycetaceae bacterium]|nr:hypothetical protein [Planctomycetaceae bacterium]
MEKITYEIIEPDGREWDSEKEEDAFNALVRGCRVCENKKIISNLGITFIKINTITLISLDHFRERNI